jgi:hypothetical protein
MRNVFDRFAANMFQMNNNFVDAQNLGKGRGQIKKHECPSFLY